MTDLGIYIHIPFCRSRCDYCGFYSVGRKPSNRFVLALQKEIERKAPAFADRLCDTVYFGGGTPSSLSASQLGDIFATLRGNFHISKDVEITMEMNPCDMSEAYLRAAKALGVNRLSVGIQSHDDRLLRAIGRLHTAAVARAAVKRAYRLGFHNISVDLMYELPGQSVEDFEKSIRWAMHLPITHMSIYSLILEEGTRMAQLAERGRLPRPTEEESWAMYQAMCRLLPHYGMERYEISSFARKGFRSRHNQKYWDLADYIGFGPAACSRIGHERRENLPGVGLYEKELLLGNLPHEEVEKLTEKDEMEEYCFLHLRKKEGIPLEDFRRRYGKELSCWYGDALDMLKARKLISETDGHLALTYKGAALGNFVFEQFLRD